MLHILISIRINLCHLSNNIQILKKNKFGLPTRFGTIQIYKGTYDILYRDQKTLKLKILTAHC